MWTVIYMAKDEENVNLILKKLKDNNIMARVKKVDDFFEVQVPSEEMTEAHNIIIDSEI
ncbi:MAG: hypothetical protein IJ304_04600 [Clostridia bacterium]|nr:hypothetical protein [Clostridia bacterium]